MTDEEGYTFEWPLWGLQLAGRPPGLDGAWVINNSLLYQPTWAQWADMESSDIVTEYGQPWASYEAAGRSGGPMPPPCLMRLSAPDRQGGPDPSEQHHDEVARATVAALRVYGAGEFVNPDETGTYVTQPSGMVVRRVSSLRCGCYGWLPDDPYVVTSEDLEEIGHLVEACWVLDHDPQHTHAGLALENFVLSFGYITPPAERALHRFIALETLFGALRAERFGTTFAQRVAKAAAEDPDDLRPWLERDGIALRNVLAHRLAGAAVEPDDLAMLEDIVRSVLIAYLNHASTRQDATVSTFNEALAGGPSVGPP